MHCSLFVHVSYTLTNVNKCHIIVSVTRVFLIIIKCDNILANVHNKMYIFIHPENIKMLMTYLVCRGV